MKIVWKILKWILIGLGSLIGFTVAIIGATLLISHFTTHRTDEWNYQVTSDNLVWLMEYKGDAETVVIPATLENLTVTKICGGAFKKDTLREVTIPATVTEVSAFAFNGCPNLVAIHVDPANEHYASASGALITADGRKLVYIPCGLTEFTVPDGIEVIGLAASGYNRKLTRVTLPEGVTTVEDSAFFANDSLVEVNLPASVTIISEAAFDHCPQLTLVVAPGSHGESWATQHSIPCRTAD